MKTEWFKGARDEEAKEERRLFLVSAAKAFEILTGILEDKIKIKETERNSDTAFDKPAYPYYQASASGYIKALNEVKSLINLKE